MERHWKSFESYYILLWIQFSCCCTNSFLQHSCSNSCLWYLIFSGLYLLSLNLVSFILCCFYSFTVASSKDFKGQLLAFNCITALACTAKGEDTLLSGEANLWQNATNILKPSNCTAHTDCSEKEKHGVSPTLWGSNYFGKSIGELERIITNVIPPPHPYVLHGEIQCPAMEIICSLWNQCLINEQHITIR